MEETKKPYLSKTILFNAILALAGVLSMLGFVPSVQGFLSGHQDMVITAIGVVGIGLRLITNGKISIE